MPVRPSSVYTRRLAINTQGNSDVFDDVSFTADDLAAYVITDIQLHAFNDQVTDFRDFHIGIHTISGSRISLIHADLHGRTERQWSGRQVLNQGDEIMSWGEGPFIASFEYVVTGWYLQAFIFP